MIGEIKTLHPVFKMAVDRILAGMRGAGWDAVIGSGMRTNAQQDALYAQGRRPLDEVNDMRRGAGLSPISATDNAKRVTKARGGQSNHNQTHSLLPCGRSAVEDAVGYAVDIVDRRFGWKPPDGKFWTDLGALAKENGCVWGGDWTDPYDPAHVEMRIVDSAPATSVTV
jgi:peptidoglycan L-alanyl-D-glutamate endopeptidase CwlK